MNNSLAHSPNASHNDCAGLNSYQVEVMETIRHLVTVSAETEQAAREQVIAVNGGDDHLIARVELKCVSVKRLGDDCKGGTHGRDN